MTAKKRSSKKSSLPGLIAKIKVEDLLLLVGGITILMIIITIGHYSLPGNEFPFKSLEGLSIIYLFEMFIKSTSYKYIYFVLVPLLVVWIAKLFQKKTWNTKKAGLWLGIGIVVMLLIYFSVPTKTGFEHIPAAETPDVKMFVMSFCPFGQQTEEIVKPVQDLFGDKVTIEPHFIFNNMSGRPVERSGCLKNNTLCSLHGLNELYENIRQMCVWKYYQEKWWDYVFCINENYDQDTVSEGWKACAEENEISVARIRACEELEGIEMAEKDRDLSDELKAYSSPTFVINGVIYQGTERTPETIKKAICKGFIEPPEECNIKLKDDAISTNADKEEKETNTRTAYVVEEIDRNKCTEEGVCPKTGKKAVPLNEGEG